MAHLGIEIAGKKLQSAVVADDGRATAEREARVRSDEGGPGIRAALAEQIAALLSSPPPAGVRRIRAGPGDLDDPRRLDATLVAAGGARGAVPAAGTSLNRENMMN